VGKHRSNSRYFKGKKLQSENFNQLNIKKVKSINIILEKINKKIEKKGKLEGKKRNVILEKNKQKK
jgi:hypothetical protein